MRREIKIRQKRIVVLFLIAALLWNHVTPMAVKATEATVETGSDLTLGDMQSISSIQEGTLLQPGDTFDCSDIGYTTYTIYYMDVDVNSNEDSLKEDNMNSDSTFTVLNYSISDMFGDGANDSTLKLNENDIFYGWIVTELVQNSSGNVITGITLQAVQGHKIEYVLGDGATNADNPDTYGEGIGVESFAAPSRTGYTFQGWYDSNNNEVETITKEATDDIILYAKWTEDEQEPGVSTPLEPGVSTPTEPGVSTPTEPDTPQESVPSVGVVAIQNGETLHLTPGTVYSLGSGSWKITGDDTVYAGEITFYVAEEVECQFLMQ